MNHAAYKLTQSSMKAIASGSIRADGIQRSEEAYRRHLSRQLEQLDMIALCLIDRLVNSFRDSQHWRNV